MKSIIPVLTSCCIFMILWTFPGTAGTVHIIAGKLSTEGQLQLVMVLARAGSSTDPR